MNYAEVQEAQLALAVKNREWHDQLQYLRHLALATVEALSAVRAAYPPLEGSEGADRAPKRFASTIVGEALGACDAGHLHRVVSTYAEELAPLLNSLGFKLVPSATLVGRHTLESQE